MALRQMPGFSLMMLPCMNTGAEGVYPAEFPAKWYAGGRSKTMRDVPILYQGAGRARDILRYFRRPQG
jgi:hypothetical protein